MRRDDIESQLRSELRAELGRLPFELDPERLRERLAERPAVRPWWLRASRQLVVGAVGAAAVLAAVMVTAVWLRALPLTGPSRGTGTQAEPPPRVLLVRELPNPGNASGTSPLLEGRLVDPVSLKPTPGAAAIAMGRFYQTALSHDGRTLALMRWPGDNPFNGELILLNLRTGKETATNLRVDGDVPVLAFSPDDQSLVWVQGDRGPGSASYGFVRFTLGDKSQVSASLPRNYWPYEGRMLSNGELAIFAVQAGTSNGTTRTPHLLVFAPSKTIRADVPIDGVLAGEIRQKNDDMAINNPGLAWDLRSEKLYVVHPDADVVTVVDLDAGRVVARVDAAAHTSWLDKLGVDTAAAKLEPGNDRSAALSPDGSRLYAVGGVRRVVGSGPTAQFSRTPTGGFVLDTRTMTRIASIDLHVDRVLAAASGRALVFSGTTLDLGVEEEAEASARMEIVVTDANLKVAARKVLKGQSWLIGLDADGSHAYVASGRSVAALTTSGLTQVGSGDGYSVEPAKR